MCSKNESSRSQPFTEMENKVFNMHNLSTALATSPVTASFSVEAGIDFGTTTLLVLIKISVNLILPESFCQLDFYEVSRSCLPESFC